MFTPDGELREEYRFLSEKSTASAEPASRETPPEPPPARPAPEPAPEPPRRGAAGRAPRAEEPPPLGFPETPPGLGPTFYDLVAMLAEPVPIYLGDMELPD